VNAAIIGYYESRAWNEDLAEGSRDMRRPILEKFREEHGDKRFAIIHATEIKNILDKKSQHAQRNFRKAVPGLIKWGIAKGLIDTDPFAAVGHAKVKQKGEFRGIIPWTPEEREQFEVFYRVGTEERLAYELLLQAGQSKCDVIRMGRQHIRNGMLSMRRKKTKVQFHVEVTSELQDAIKAMPPSDHLTFLTTEQGKPFTAAGFGNWFRQVCNDARREFNDR
jgi:imidazolonepropionase-like amidohydrolase